MRFKILAGTAFALAAAAASALPAASVGIVTVNGGSGPVPITADGQVVNVAWSGFNGPVFAEQCFRSIALPDFNPSTDCDYDTNGGIVLAPTTGTAQFAVFRGDRTLLQQACGTSNEGLPISNPCYIRLTSSSHENTVDDVEVAITFTPDTVIPEVPYSVLLPLGAMAAIGAGIYLNRRRVAA